MWPLQYRVAQPGEVLAGGAKVLNLVDLGDVYLTFFLPETVETASERQKMMFRVKVQINHDLLHKYFKQVKTGLLGVAWLKNDSNATWPENLQIKVPE